MASIITTPVLPKGFNTASLAKADVTNGTTTVAWTTANTGLTLFTITGAVLARIYGVVTATGLTSTGTTGTLSVGNAGNAQLFLPTTTANGTNLVANTTWLDNAPTVNGKVLAAANLTWASVNGGTVTLTIATNNMTAGGMTLYCDWIPVSAGASVV